MKSFYFLSITLLNSVIGFSQTYKPMLKENKTWDILDEDFSPNPPCNFTYMYYLKYYLEGDTIVDGFQYYKLQQQKATIYPMIAPGLCAPSLPPLVYDTLETFSGILLREDSVQRKIWKKEVFGSDTSEYLIYNFSLNIGDTMTSMSSTSQFTTGFIGSPVKGVIDSISFITLNNNDITRVFYINPIDFYSFDHPFYIMEGVGSLQGFHSPFKHDFESTYHLVCVNDEGINLFSNPNYSCGYLLNDKNEVKKGISFEFFPNPNNGENISIVGENIKTVDILNIQGQLIKTIEVTTNEIRINIENKTKGIYFVKSKFKNGAIVIKKLVIN